MSLRPNKVTNLQLMQKEKAPYGPDGKRIALHHMLQTQEGSIAEVAQTFHTSNDKIIHINPNTISSAIDRNAFKTWKRNYWKNRAKDFEQ